MHAATRLTGAHARAQESEAPLSLSDDDLVHASTVSLRTPVVAVATSSGGLRALIRLLSTLPAAFPAALVVVLHADPQRPSYLAAILARRTRLRVEEACSGGVLRAGTVYVAPAGRKMAIRSDGRVLLAPLVHAASPATADMLFLSLAVCYGARAIAVVLTGRGRDGAAGVRAIKRYGGTVIVQELETSEFPDMPAAALASAAVDFTLPLGQVATCLVELLRDANGEQLMMSMETTQAFDVLLEYLKKSRGFDFSGYKRTSLERRMRKRMALIAATRFEEYLDYLEVHPEEFAHLFNGILINVTSFFRDQPVWDYLRSEILPRIVAAKRPDEPIRIWSAGCASGEEPYSLAITFAEALGVDQFRDRVKIYATDVDEDALNRARQATYTAREVDGMPSDLIEKYFEQSGGRFVFRKELRRSVIFGRHDLVQDAPISRVDLLACRNTLMYFNSETQARILARFHFAVNDTGYLFLGKAEMLLTHTNLFTPVDLKRRIFAKSSKSNLRDRLMVMAQAGNDEAVSNLVGQVRTHEAAFDAGPVSQIVVDVSGLLTLANERARSMFGLNVRDVGRPLQDLELSYRPLELRSCIEQAYAEHRTISLREVEWQSGSHLLYLDVDVTPLSANGNAPIGVSITFIDVSRYRRLQDELVHSSQELETAYEELQSTNEELETTNEELQSTVEELETTNEELQSTNEELETMNEELQSTNEELQTINDELRQRSDELNQLNSFLQSILIGLRQAVVVLDGEMHVQIWSPKAEEIWGLRDSEVVGKHLLMLDAGLPVAELRPYVRAALVGEGGPSEVTLPATNRRGRAIRCAVTCTPLLGAQNEVRGVILLMDESAEPNG